MHSKCGGNGKVGELSVHVKCTCNQAFWYSQAHSVDHSIHDFSLGFL